MKTCIFCQHFYLSMASPGYSEYTPGSDFSMICLKDRWRFDQFGTQEHYHSCLKSAEVCPDYSEVKRLIDIKPAIQERQ
jgi:hypothetical protein